jgi:hypothetical protein
MPLTSTLSRSSSPYPSQLLAPHAYRTMHTNLEHTLGSGQKVTNLLIRTANDQAPKPSDAKEQCHHETIGNLQACCCWWHNVFMCTVLYSLLKHRGPEKRWLYRSCDILFANYTEISGRQRRSSTKEVKI